MKNLIFTILILAVAGACGASLFDYFNALYDQASQHVTTLANQNYAFEHAGSVFGGLVAEDENISMSYNLERGRTYNVFLFGDEDANDLDIKIYDAEGELVESDTAVSRNAQITFSPSRTGNYRIEAINYSSDDNVFMLGGMMARGSRRSNTATLFAQAFQRMITAGSALDEEEDVYFFLNTICFGGGIVEEDDNGCIFDIQFPSSSDVWVAAVASDNCDDVDVKLTRQNRRGRVDSTWSSDDAELVCSEASTEAVSLADGSVSSDYNYAVKYRNYSSDGDAFVVYFIVRD